MLNSIPVGRWCKYRIYTLLLKKSSTYLCGMTRHEFIRIAPEYPEHLREGCKNARSILPSYMKMREYFNDSRLLN